MDVDTTSKVSLQDAVALLNELRVYYNTNPCDLSACKALLQKCKLVIAFLPAASLEILDTDAQHEVQVIVEILELGALVSVRTNDVTEFERYVSQLFIYYMEYFDYIKAFDGTQYLLIIGLYLLYLLCEDRLGEYHMNLELLTPQDEKLPYIEYVKSVENHLMTGNYNKLLLTHEELPHPLFSYFIRSLLLTVRLKMANCLEKAYNDVEASHARKILRFDSDAELSLFAQTRNDQNKSEENEVHWVFGEQKLLFVKHSTVKQDIGAMQLIENCIGYATELERIV